MLGNRRLAKITRFPELADAMLLAIRPPTASRNTMVGAGPPPLTRARAQGPGRVAERAAVDELGERAAVATIDAVAVEAVSCGSVEVRAFSARRLLVGDARGKQREVAHLVVAHNGQAAAPASGSAE